MKALSAALALLISAHASAGVIPFPLPATGAFPDLNNNGRAGSDGATGMPGVFSRAWAHAPGAEAAIQDPDITSLLAAGRAGGGTWFGLQATGSTRHPWIYTRRGQYSAVRAEASPAVAYADNTTVEEPATPLLLGCALLVLALRRHAGRSGV